MVEIDPRLRAKVISDLMADINKGVRKKTGVDMPDDQIVTLAEVHLEFLIEIVSGSRDGFRAEDANILKERLVKPLVGQGLTVVNAILLIDYLFSQS